MAHDRSLKGGGGKRYGHTKDIRPPAQAIVPIVEPHNNSQAMAEKQLVKSNDNKKGAGKFAPKDNAQYK